MTKAEREKILKFWDVQEKVAEWFSAHGLQVSEIVLGYCTCYVATQAVVHNWHAIWDSKIKEAYSQLFRHPPTKLKAQSKSAILRYLATQDAWAYEAHKTVLLSDLQGNDSLPPEEFLIPSLLPSSNENNNGGLDRLKTEIERVGVWHFAEMAFLESLERYKQKQRKKKLLAASKLLFPSLSHAPPPELRPED